MGRRPSQRMLFVVGQRESLGSARESNLCVAIITSHPMFGDSIGAALRQRGHRPTHAPIEPFTAMSRAVHGTDVVLVFSCVPPLDGFSVTRSLLARDPSLRIVIIEHTADSTAPQRAIRAGATASIGSRTSLEDGLSIVERAASGDSTFGSGSDRSCPDLDVRTEPSLSIREHEILQLIVDGLDVREIAIRLLLSAKTVKHHLSSIYSKLGSINRTSAVVEGLRRGIVDLRSPGQRGGT